MRDKKQIEMVVNGILEGSQYFLVDLVVNKANLIRIFIDHPEQVSLENCVEWHRQIEEHLDREEEDFELQVSSAGLDQPFKDIRQYHKHIGQSLSIIQKDGTQVRGELKEVLESSDESSHKIIVLPRRTKKRVDPEPQVLEIGEIKIAKVEIIFDR